MDIIDGMQIKGYKDRFKVIELSEDEKSIRISFNGQMPRDYALLYDSKDSPYFLYKESEKVIIKHC